MRIKFLSHASRTGRTGAVFKLDFEQVALGNVSTTVAITSIASSFRQTLFPILPAIAIPLASLTLLCVTITAPSAVPATVFS